MGYGSPAAPAVDAYGAPAASPVSSDAYGAPQQYNEATGYESYDATAEDSQLFDLSNLSAYIPLFLEPSLTSLSLFSIQSAKSRLILPTQSSPHSTWFSEISTLALLQVVGILAPIGTCLLKMFSP